jgi:hypothetical protein
MSKKLMFLISGYGKTSEQLGKECWEAFVHYRATDLGLTKCNKCGEYKGTDDDEKIKV